MSEQWWIDWFVAHPFWRNEALLGLGALSGLAKADWEAFKAHQVDVGPAPFLWSVALRQYAKAFVIAIVPPLVAELWRIVGG